MKYILTMLDATAYNWNNSEGEGDFVSAYDLNIKSKPFKELTGDNIITAIQDAIPVDNKLTFDDLYIDNEYINNETSVISFNQIEDADGFPDSNGNYIVDYTCQIERLELVDLSKIAQN